MVDLVALDVVGGPTFLSLLRRVWEEGDAVCVHDQRLSGESKERNWRALSPTHRMGEDGEKIPCEGGHGVEVGDALVVVTSGSSGTPKAAVLTHDALKASARITSAALGVDPQRHSWLACLPLTHIGGFSVVSRALLTGTPLIIHPRFTAQKAQSEGVTHISLVTAALAQVDPTLFTCILLGGAAPPEKLPPNVVTTYGMTETGSGVVYDGKPLSGVKVAIDEGGQILLSSPTLLRCYRDGSVPFVRGPDGTNAWLATGDGGEIDHEGYLHVFGRLGEVIVSGGEKVWPNEVEAVLSHAAKVGEVAVWKRDDQKWGERVVAHVVPTTASDPPQLAELVAHVREHLPPWAAPKELVLHDALPRTPSGKVRRRALI